MDVELVVTMAISRSMLIIVTILSTIYVVTSFERGVREQYDQINHKPNTLKNAKVIAIFKQGSRFGVITTGLSQFFQH